MKPLSYWGVLGCYLLIFLGTLHTAEGSCLAALFSGDQQNPPANTTAFGRGTGALTGSSGNWAFNYSITFSDLLAPLISAHIHGIALPGMNAGIVHTIQIINATGGVLSGSWVSNSQTEPLTDDLAAALLNGSAYFNLHTSMYPDGEIRGQIQTCSQCYSASLTGSQQAPAVNTTGTGISHGTLTGSSGQWNFTYAIAYQNLVSPVISSHIHGPALPGSSAPIVHPIAIQVNTTEGTVTGSWDSSSGLTDDLVQALYEGRLYFNIHSEAYPDGEIRGQIYASTTCNYCTYSVLRDANEVPIVNSPAVGAATGYLQGTIDNWVYNYQLTYIGTATPVVSAYIHGPASRNANAPIIHTIPIEVGSVRGSVVNTWRSGDSQPLTNDLALQLMLGQTYINIYTENFPGGAIRGQIDPASCPCYGNCTICFGSALLTAAQGSIPLNNSPSKGAASVILIDSPYRSSISYRLVFSELSDQTISAHIHAGLFGQSGPIVHTLQNFPLGVTVGISAGVWNSTDVPQNLTRTNIADFYRTALYFNVHTQSFPNGEIRSQIVPQGCASSSGIVPPLVEPVTPSPSNTSTPSPTIPKPSQTAIFMDPCLTYQTCRSCTAVAGCTYCNRGSVEDSVCMPSTASDVCN